MFWALRAIIAYFNIIGHTGTDVFCDIKNFTRIILNMPFPAHVGAISGLFEVLWPGMTVQYLTMHIVFIVDCVGIPYGSPSKEHSTAGNADGSVPRSHVIRSGETGTSAQKTIKVGRIDVGFTMGGDGFIGHIVGKDKNKVRRRVGVTLANGSGMK